MTVDSFFVAKLQQKLTEASQNPHNLLTSLCGNLMNLPRKVAASRKLETIQYPHITIFIFAKLFCNKKTMDWSRGDTFVAILNGHRDYCKVAAETY